MLKFFLKRVWVLVPTFFGVTLLAFALIRLIPGDPIMVLLGERGADPETYQQMRTNLGLNGTLPAQYLNFVSKAVQGDLGNSIVTSRKVLEEFLELFPATVELGLVALIFSVLLGIPMGILAAVKRNTIFDYSVIGASLVGFSMPIFWWGLVLIIVFSVTLGWTPVSGRIDVMYDIPHVTGLLLIDVWLAPGAGFPAFLSALKHLVLPAIVLGTIPLAVITRMTRSSLLEVLSEDYIRTAKAKGLSRFRVIWIHALRNAMVPVATVIGLMLGTLVTGAILTETIFSWPGIGKWIVGSVVSRDYPVVQGGILLIALIIVTLNMIMDMVYAVINPRIRDLSS